MTPFSLAFASCADRPYRTTVLTVLTALVCMTMFITNVLQIKAKECAGQAASRLGADMVLVPYGYEGRMESALLRGEPSAFYMDGELVEHLKKIPGVTQAAGQLFLASLHASCCDLPIQMIGFDPDNDCTVTPWIAEGKSSPADGEILVGCNVRGNDDGTVRLFGKNLKIVGRLAETGLGFDTSVFMNMAFARKLLFSSALARRLNIPEGVKKENLISSVMIKIEENYSIDALTDVIYQEYSRQYGFSIIRSSAILAETSAHLAVFATFFRIFSLLFWGIALAVFAIVFSMIFRERQAEFGYMRIAGASAKMTVYVAALETFYIGGFGGLFGTCVAGLGIWLFLPWFEISFFLPSSGLSLQDFLSTAGLSFLISSSIGPLSCLFAAKPLFSDEIYLISKENL